MSKSESTVSCFILFVAMMCSMLRAEAPVSTNASIAIRLRNGATLDGAVLKETSRFVFFDFGFEVLAIPRNEIEEITETAPAQAVNNPAADDKLFYKSRRLTRTSTENSAERFAPAVVVVRSPGGLGSGFFINKRGYLITNFHVIQGQTRISVTRFVLAGSELKRVNHSDVRIVAVDPFHDLAVLQIKAKKIADQITPVVFSPDDAPKLGETVFVIGNPLGLERSVTKGILSQTARNYKGKLYLQLDAPVNPGNSGGPLFNDRGEVIGVINMQIPIMQGLNFAIPVRYVKFLLDHLEDYAYDQTNSESGYIYPDPPRRPTPGDDEKKKNGE